MKILPKFFEPVKRGTKTFEIRKDDRDYKVGDVLVLKEWSDIVNNFTGRSVTKQISYIYRGLGQYGLARGYVILSIKDVERKSE